MSIDASTHSLFGVSKAAADLLVQEYGRYFGMPTVCFRGGCLTGPNHAGTRLHGFLSYLMRCTMTGRRRTRCTATAASRSGTTSTPLISSPPSRLSTGRRAAPRSTTSAAAARATARCSRRSLCEAIAGRELKWELSDENRIGDHRWWISDLEPFRRDYPEWEITYGIDDVLREIYEQNAEHGWRLAEYDDAR